MEFLREQWLPGDEAYFEYHCTEAHESAHAEWWYRSHQKIIVLGETDHDGWPGSTFRERAEASQPKVYSVRWPDGFEGAVFEDELLTSPSGYSRPEPERKDHS